MSNVKATSLHHLSPKTLLKKKVTQRQLCGCGLDAVWMRQKQPRAGEAGLQNMPAVGTSQDGEHTNLFHHLRWHHPSNYTESVTLWAEADTTPHTHTHTQNTFLRRRCHSFMNCHRARATFTLFILEMFTAQPKQFDVTVVTVYIQCFSKKKFVLLCILQYFKNLWEVKPV